MPQATAAPVPLIRLFTTCLGIGAFSFGGGLSGWIYREFVDRNGWISDEDFVSTMAICQILPGANVINLVICLGELLRGAKGAFACFLGFLLVPVFAVVALSMVIDHLSDSTLLETGLAGVAFAAIGLLLVICWKGAMRARRKPVQLVIIAAVALTVGLLRLPLIPVVAVVVPVSILLAMRRHRGGQ